MKQMCRWVCVSLFKSVQFPHYKWGKCINAVTKRPKWAVNTQKTNAFSCSLSHKGLTTAGSSSYLIWQSFTSETFPDTILPIVALKSFCKVAVTKNSPWKASWDPKHERESNQQQPNYQYFQFLFILISFSVIFLKIGQYVQKNVSIEHFSMHKLQINSTLFCPGTSSREQLWGGETPLGHSWVQHGQSVSEICPTVMDGTYLPLACSYNVMWIVNNHFLET